MSTDPSTLADIHDITTLKYRYGRCLDTREWDGFAATLAPDATARYGTVSQGDPLHFDGRDAIVDYMRTSLTGNIVSTHTFGNPEITVDGDQATGSWSMSDVVIAPDFDTVITGTSYYSDRYAKIDGRWYISHTEYYRLYEAITPMASSGMQLIANRWSSSPPST
ncbi:putative dehydratase [Gordonia araii NBRC 100433]|uniref:Putative dehydratase n=1 Tax=Gordonia araii NBRC 100433 TaxID=1073574 RepID=G7H5V0_9ACTN|nr:nuclear transport factor 2 family protein [Gordonia araii]NNG95699.1 nuclear transport factor 2 family protein [Gordonia araii NBRC 100433]GAB11225.1 putative dehydratase [Gordonia araii NBRC 100433]